MTYNTNISTKLYFDMQLYIKSSAFSYNMAAILN